MQHRERPLDLVFRVEFHWSNFSIRLPLASTFSCFKQLFYDQLITHLGP